MELQERINALEAQQVRARSAAAESDRAALDYVKSLPGFAEAYPQYAQSNSEVQAAAAQVEETLAEVRAEWALRIGESVFVGDIVYHNGIKYEVLQAHILQEDWVPGEVPALYKRVADDGDEFPEFVQPTGAHDAYKTGDKITFGGKHWVSEVDGNVWEPGVYGWTEV